MSIIDSLRNSLRECKTRDEAVAIYVQIIDVKHVQWPVINGIVLSRFGANGLRFIRDEAWKIYDLRREIARTRSRPPSLKPPA